MKKIKSRTSVGLKYSNIHNNSNSKLYKHNLNKMEKDRKNKYHENEGPEEGEIVDEFEDISSDEELTMMKRIEELEARNAELEKIANLTRIHDYDSGSNDRCQQLDSVSNGYDTYKHTKTYDGSTKRSIKSKRRFSAVVERSSKHHCKSSDVYNYHREHEYFSSSPIQSSSTKHHGKHKKKNQKSKKCRKRTVKHKRKMHTDETSSDDEIYPLNREKLRIAVKRNVSQKKHTQENYKDSLKHRKYSYNGRNTIETPNVINLVSDDEYEKEIHTKDRLNTVDNVEYDTSESLEEQQLRLIALKSALDKKCSDGEESYENDDLKPYSPSDFVERFDLDDTNSSKTVLDAEDLNNMDISPIASPEQITENDCVLKSVDMDLVRSNSTSPKLFEDQIQIAWELIDETPSHTDDNTHLPIPTKNVENTPLTDLKINNDDEKVVINRTSSPETTDEEELALRALLLAKMSSTNDYECKRNHIIGCDNAVNSDNLVSHHAKENKPPTIDNVPDSIAHNSDTAIDLEKFRHFILTTVNSKPAKRTEFVLKEAVKRLRHKVQHKDNVIVDKLSDSTQQQYDAEVSSNLSNLSNKALMIDESTNTNLPDDVRNEFSESNLLDTVNIFEKNNFNEKNNIVDSSKQPIDEESSIKNSDKIHQIPVIIRGTPLQNIEPENNIEIHQIPPEIVQPNAAIQKQNQSKVLAKKPSGQKIKTGKVTKTRTKIVNNNNNVKTSIIPENIDSIAKNDTKTKLLQSLAVNETRNSSLSSSTSFVSRNRLVTFPNMPKVEKIVIRLGESDSDSDDIEFDREIERINSSCDCDDNASPMSLLMDSPAYSPVPAQIAPLSSTLPSEKTVDVGDDHNKKETVNECNADDVFQAKLDEFLKNARTKVEQYQKGSKGSTVATSKMLTSKTPLAVRHLPQSSQLEYRRLINRMKMLEKQKKMRSIQADANRDQLKVTIKNDDKTEDVAAHRLVVTDTAPENNIPNSLNDINQKEKLVKKILIKNATNLGMSPTEKKENESERIVQTENEGGEISSEKMSGNQIKVEEDIIQKIVGKEDLEGGAGEGKFTEKQKEIKPLPEKLPERGKTQSGEKVNRCSGNEERMAKLKACENQITRNNGNLLKHITNTINLVLMAKTEKLRKFSLQSKLDELKRQMKQTETELLSQNYKLSKIIYPQISNNQKVIFNLREKNTNLNKVAVNLGKTIHGSDYRFQCNNKSSVLDKSKRLTSELKVLNTLKPSDLEETSILKWITIQKCSKIKKESEETKETISSKHVELKESSNTAVSIKEETLNDDLQQSDGKKDTDRCQEDLLNSSTNIHSVNEQSNIAEDDKRPKEDHLNDDLEDVKNASKQDNYDFPDGNSSDNIQDNKNLEDSLVKKSEITEKRKEIDCEEQQIIMSSSSGIATGSGQNESNCQLKKESLTAYNSPLDYIHQDRIENPTGIFCPYQLMGQCDDKECKFIHFGTS